MQEHEALAERFEANRAHLRAVAYRMLGSISEADDAVQEAWLRLRCSGSAGVENISAWLTTVVARVPGRRAPQGAPTAFQRSEVVPGPSLTTRGRLPSCCV